VIDLTGREACDMLDMLRDCLGSKLMIDIVLLGIAGGLYSIARKLKA
jgi:hypothetical protein